MVIDCDSHILLLDAFEHVPLNFLDGCALSGLHSQPLMLKARMPEIVLDDDGRFREIHFPGNPANIPGATPIASNDPSLGIDYSGNIDMQARLRDFTRMGVDLHFVLPQFTGWWSYLLEPSIGSAIAHSWNVSLLALMQRYPSHICGVALIPLQDVSASVRELQWAHENGFAAIVLDPIYPVAEHPYGTTLASHREIWPFLQVVQELTMPIFLHAVQHGHRILNLPRFQPHGLYLCAPTDAELNLTSLITSGLLDDFPALQFIHAETGVAGIKPLVERLDARFGGVAKSDPSFKDLPLVPAALTKEKNKYTPSHYLRNNFYWTVETEEPELVEAIGLIGAHRFLFATDYPHNDSGGINKFGDVERLRSNPAITETDKESIRSGNARRLFRL
jgi:predicted TIM-barrel fold metal-dependent hydrolase